VTCPSEKHESVFNIDLFFLSEQPVCEILESDFNIGLVKYMKVISTMVL